MRGEENPSKWGAEATEFRKKSTSHVRGLREGSELKKQANRVQEITRQAALKQHCANVDEKKHSHLWLKASEGTAFRFCVAKEQEEVHQSDHYC